MNSPNVQLTTSAYFGILFFVLLIVAIFMKETIFSFIISATGGSQIQESQEATKQTADLLLSLDKITLDTSVLNSEYLQALNPLPSFPLDSETISNFGKTNPFLGSFIVVPGRATSTVGGVIYSNQRGANEGNSIIPVNTNRR